MCDMGDWGMLKFCPVLCTFLRFTFFVCVHVYVDDTQWRDRYQRSSKTVQVHIPFTSTFYSKVILNCTYMYLYRWWFIASVLWSVYYCFWTKFRDAGYATKAVSCYQQHLLITQPHNSKHNNNHNHSRMNNNNNSNKNNTTSAVDSKSNDDYFKNSSLFNSSINNNSNNRFAAAEDETAEVNFLLQVFFFCHNLILIVRTKCDFQY